MDIQNILDQARQRGLSAIDSIKKSNVSVGFLGQSFIKPVIEPIAKPVVPESLSFTKNLPTKTLTVKPLTQQQQTQTTSSFALPKPSEIIFGEPAKEVNKRFEYNWSKLVGEFENFVKTNVAPAARNYVQTINEAGSEITPLDIALAPADKRKELTTKLGEQQKATVNLESQLALGGLQIFNIPSETFNRTVFQPWYQTNVLLKEREQLLGIKPTQEELRAASLGDLNLSSNTLLNIPFIPITNQMTSEERKRAEENNFKYYLNEVRDTGVALLDADILLGATAIGKNVLERGVAKLTAKTTKEAAEKSFKATPEDLINAVGKGDKEEISKIIKRPLTASEDLQIDLVNDIVKSDLFTNDLRDLRRQTFFEKIQDDLSESAKKLNQLWEERKTKNLQFEKNTAYDKSIDKLRQEAAGNRTLKEKIGDFWLDLRRAYWNDLSFSFETIDRIAKETGNLKRSENPKYFADSLKKTSEQTEIFLENNGFYKSIETAVKEAKELFKKSVDVIDNFGNFLLARRKVTLHDLGIQKLDEAQYKIYLDVYNERKDRYVEATKQFDEFINKLVKRAEEAGILTPEQVKTFLETGDYAPFYRIFNEYTSAPRNRLIKSKKDLGQQSVFRELSFDEGVVKNPLEAAQLMTYSLIDQANRNTYAKKWGELIRRGLLKGSYIIRDASNVIKQQQIKDSLEELNKAREKLTKIIKKTKGAVKQLTKEVNALSRRGIQLSLKSKPGAIDPAEKQKFLEKIKVLSKNREKLVKDLEKLNLKDLELQKDKAYFGYESGTPKPQLQNILDGKVVKKENLLLKLMFKTDSLVKEKAIKYLNKNYGLFFDKMTDRQLLNFFRNTNIEELETFINVAFDLKPKQYDTFIKKLSKLKGKEADVIRELNDAKNAAFENKIVEALYNKETDIIKNFNSLSDDLQKIIKEININKSNIYYNDLFNSLVRKSPEELKGIKKELSKKEPILNNLVDTLIKQQEELDVKTGYAKELKEEAALIDELDANGQPFISWLNNGVREIAVVDKRLAEEFFEINTVTDEKLMNAVTNFLVNATKLWKAGTTTFIPDSRLAQFAKDSSTIPFFFDGEVRNSLINPLLFLKALKEDVVAKSPEYAKFIELGGGGSFNTSLGDSQTLKNFASKVSKEINYSTLSSKTIDALDKAAGFDEITWRFRIYQTIREDLIKKGMDPQEAELEAIWQSNNVLPNYFQTGSASNVLELGLTYSKVKMQSAKVMLEMFKRDPAKATFLIARKVAIPTTVITAWNMLDADRAKVYNDIPEDKKKKNIIIIMPNPINPDGSYKNPITIPVEETIMGYANPFRRASEEAILAGDTQAITAFAREFLSPKSAQSVLEATTGVTVPLESKQAIKDIGSSINPIFRGPFELARNYEFFREKNIVPDDVKLRSAVNQWDEKTSLLAKEIGLQTNVSPMVIDWFIRTYAQGLSKYTQRPLEEAIKAAKNDPELNIETKSPVENLINRFSLEVKPGAKAAQESYEILDKKKQEDADRNFVVKQAMASGDLDKLKSMAPLLTEAQFNQLYTSMQKQAAQVSLNNVQKVLFNSSEPELNRIEKEKPELSGDIAYIKEYKKEVSKLPGLDTRGFDFMPSESKGRGPSLSIKASKIKLPKVSKPRRIRMPKLAAPKKVKVSKPKKIKPLKVARVKPLKRVKRF
jgi:hypothetical protein